jgi:hypothetical protein
MNIFLSEFKRPFVHRRGWSVWLAAGLVLAVGGVCVLGHYANADYLSLKFAGLLTDSAGTRHESESVPYQYGYLVEMSHAPFFLLLAPLFVILTELFLCKADEAVKLLESTKRLVAPSGVTVANKIERKNANVFGRLILPLFAAFVVYGFFIEGLSYYQNSPARDANSRRMDLGYVQAPFVAEWVDTFNRLTAGNQLVLAPLPVQIGISNSALSSLNVLRATSSNLITNWGPAIKIPGLTHPSSVEVTSYWSSTGAVVSLVLPAAAANGLLSFEADISPEAKMRSRPWLHFAFLVALLLVEGLFHGFIAWTLFKIGFWIMLVYRWLPRTDAQTVRFRVRFNDSECKYGLPELYTPYNFISLLLLIGALGVALNYLSNADKHTWVSDNVGLFYGPVLIILASSIGLLMVVCGPMALFQLRLFHLKNRQIALLREEQAKCDGDPVCLKKIQEDIDLTNKQWTWPVKDPNFRKIMALAALLLVIPFILKLPMVPSKVEQTFNILAGMKKAVLAIAEWLHK